MRHQRVIRLRCRVKEIKVKNQNAFVLHCQETCIFSLNAVRKSTDEQQDTCTWNLLFPLTVIFMPHIFEVTGNIFH